MSIVEYSSTAPIFSAEKFFVAPPQTELTLREAADLLFVSEPFMASLLDSGKIPYQKIGNQYRIKSDDLLAFSSEQKRFHLEMVDELVEEGQLFNPNY